MKKAESFPYTVFVGSTKNSLSPTVVCKTKEEAIVSAKSLAVPSKVNKYAEVVYMPEDNIGINEVVWKNFK